MQVDATGWKKILNIFLEKKNRKEKQKKEKKNRKKKKNQNSERSYWSCDPESLTVVDSVCLLERKEKKNTRTRTNTTKFSG